MKMDPKLEIVNNLREQGLTYKEIANQSGFKYNFCYYGYRIIEESKRAEDEYEICKLNISYKTYKALLSMHTICTLTYFHKIAGFELDDIFSISGLYWIIYNGYIPIYNNLVKDFSNFKDIFPESAVLDIINAVKEEIENVTEMNPDWNKLNKNWYNKIKYYRDIIYSSQIATNIFEYGTYLLQFEMKNKKYIIRFNNKCSDPELLTPGNYDEPNNVTQLCFKSNGFYRSLSDDSEFIYEIPLLLSWASNYYLNFRKNNKIRYS